MNLANAFAASAQKRMDKVALYWGETEITYSTLLGQTRSVAARLAADFGVKPGDRVGLWLKNRPEFVPAYFGILFAGAVVVPINNFLKPGEVSFMLNDCGADVIISDEELAAHFPELAAARPGLKLLKVEDSGGAPGTEATDGTRTEADLAVIIYTSGTTGRPKGAMLSHGNLLHNVESCRIVLETVDADRFTVLLPLFHSYMMTVGMLLPLLVGGSMVLIKSLHPQHHIIKEICERQATILPAIPQFYRALANLPAQVKLPLRLAVSGAAPLPVQVLHDFEAKHHIPIIEGYGLSEASPVVSKNPLRGERKPGSIGIPVTNVEMSIQDDTGKILGPGETGEVCVRGGNVIR
jgi:long-chain acyl-CoA synthetase